MSFLEELEEDSKKNNSEEKKPEKQPRDLWESCYKYFRQFHSILLKNKNGFPSKFNLTTISKEIPCQIVSPFILKRHAIGNDLVLEIKFITQLTQVTKINRKDERSADYLKSKFAKDGILSIVMIDENQEYYIQLKDSIPSSFKLILVNNSDFFIEYYNVHSSAKKRIRLAVEKINQETMDDLAKYILGKNPNLYREKISEEERKQIQQRLNKNQKKKIESELIIQEQLNREELAEQEAKANTLKEKSKRYITKQSKNLGKNLMSKISRLKNKSKK